MASIPFCDPCHRGNNSSEAVSWCSDCAESLCTGCDSAHRINKITLSHTLIKIEDMPPQMSASLSSQKFCPNHEGLALDLFCITHDNLCCRQCMTERHRGCERLVPLDVVSKEVRKAPLLQEISRDVEDMLKTMENLKENRKKNLEHLLNQSDTIKKEITDVKQKIIDRLDSLEHALLSELSTLHLLKSSDIEKQQEKIEEFIGRAKESKEELEVVKEFGSNSQVFITLQKLKLSTKEERKRLKTITYSLKDIQLIYNQPKNQESLFTSLGTLITKVDQSYQSVPEQKRVVQDKVSLPSIYIRQTPRTPTTLKTRNLETGNGTTRKTHETVQRSGRSSKASNNSSKTTSKPKSPVNDCKTS